VPSGGCVGMWWCSGGRSELPECGNLPNAEGHKMGFPIGNAKTDGAENKLHCRQVSGYACNMIYQKCLVVRLFYVSDR